jgi:hypothetical protein
LAEEVEPRKPGESLVAYLMRLENLGLEPYGLVRGEPAVLRRQTRLLPFRKSPEPPLPPPRRQQGESLADYIRRLEGLGFKVVGLRWVPKEPSPPAPSGKVLQFPPRIAKEIAKELT